MNEYKSWLGVLPGWTWLYENQYKYNDWKPTIEVIRPGAHYIVVSKTEKIANQAIKEILR